MYLLTAFAKDSSIFASKTIAFSFLKPSLEGFFPFAFAPGPGAGFLVLALILTESDLIPISFITSLIFFAMNIAIVGFAFNLSCLVTIPPVTFVIVFPERSVTWTIVLLKEVYMFTTASISFLLFSL